MLVRKEPRISKVCRKKKLNFVKTHINDPLDFQKIVIFSDEDKCNICGSNEQKLVCKKTRKLLKNIRSTVKHGEIALQYEAVSTKGLGSLHFINEVMDKYKYLNISTKQ